MKPVLMSDVTALARALRAAPESSRASLISTVFKQAQDAATFVQTHGRTHPKFGNGTIMAASATHPQVPEPWLTDRVYCRCLMQILAYLSEH